MKKVTIHSNKLETAIIKLEKMIYSNLLSNEKNIVYINNLNKIKSIIKGM